MLEIQEIELNMYFKREILKGLSTDKMINELFNEVRESHPDYAKFLTPHKLGNLIKLIYADDCVTYDKGSEKFSITPKGVDYLILSKADYFKKYC